MAVFAVVRHPVDVRTGRGIGFAGHQAAIGVHDHAQRVGQLHPVVGVCVNRQIPVADLRWLNAGQQCKIAGNHKALNVVCVGIVEGVFQTLCHAVHARVTGPVTRWQIALIPKVVVFGIVWHQPPVKPAHVFAPADDLAYESFGGVDGHITFLPGTFRCLAHFDRGQEAHIQTGGQQAMKQEWLPVAHGILVLAKIGQAVFDEKS